MTNKSQQPTSRFINSTYREMWVQIGREDYRNGVQKTKSEVSGEARQHYWDGYYAERVRDKLGHIFKRNGWELP